MGATFLDMGMDSGNITPRLRCPRCQGPVKVGIYAERSGYPMLLAVCSSIGTACGGKKLTDYPLVFNEACVQIDINIREIVRRFSQALKVIVGLREGSGDPTERLAGAIHVAETALQGVVPVEDRSIGAPTESDAAMDIARGLSAGRPAAEVAPRPPGVVEHRTPGGIVIPAPGTFPRSCRDCGAKVMAHKEQNPVLCAACEQRHKNNELAKQMFGTGPVAPPGNEERTCIKCGAPVMMAIGSEETPICAACSTPDASSDESPALPEHDDEPEERSATIPIPPPPVPGEKPMWEHYGYPSEDAYYRTEFGGADCPACGRTLDPTGRHHADGSTCPDAVS
jgi:hypothetical protein